MPKYDICHSFILFAARQPDWLPFVVFFGATLSIGLALYGLAGWMDARRRKLLAEFAQEKGFSFLPEAGALLQSQWDDFWLFNQGRSRRTFNVLGAKLGELDVRIFDYEYRTGHGKHSQTHRNTVVAFSSEDLSLPRLKIRPRGFWGRIVRGIYDPGIAFEDHPDFNRSYCVESLNKTRARTVVTPAAIETFSEKPGWWVEMKMNWVCACQIHSPRTRSFFHADNRPKPEELMAYLGDALEIFQSLAPEVELAAKL